MFGGFDASVQRAIRKAEKSDLAVEVATSLDAMRVFYRLHCGTRQKHGVPPQPFCFFKALHQHVLEREKGFIVTARLGSKAVASAIFCYFGTKALYKFGASDERFQHLRGNNLVLWEAIRRLARQGIRELNFGRTSLDNEGLRRFKLGWGAEESRINYCKFSLNEQRFVEEVDRASGWHNRVFGLVPRPLARCVGTFLYARLA
jgi:lipid II:glycine glycyltransferase (peptidoglycan interpeptide bridge formation enzyme)